MAEIITAKPGKRRKHDLRVDLTPMVDLGFLLVSFFVFTATMMEPKILDLVMPMDGPEISIPESGAVTIITTANKIFYYHGNTPPVANQLSALNYREIETLRSDLLLLKQRLIRANGNDDKLMVIIKPGDDSEIGQLVGVLDEMSICDISRYTVGTLQESEKQLLASL